MGKNNEHGMGDSGYTSQQRRGPHGQEEKKSAGNVTIGLCEAEKVAGGCGSRRKHYY